MHLCRCVPPYVFLLCHRWEAGHQEGEPGRFHVHSDTGRAHDAWRLQEGVLPRFRERVCFNRVHWVCRVLNAWRLHRVRPRVMGMVLTGARVALGTVISPHYWVPVGFLKLGVSKIGCSLASRWGFHGHGHQVCVGSSRSGASKNGELPRFSERDHFGSRHIKHMQFTVLRAWRLQEGVQPRFRTRVSSRQATSLTYTGASGGLRFGGDGTSKSIAKRTAVLAQLAWLTGGLFQHREPIEVDSLEKSYQKMAKQNGVKVIEVDMCMFCGTHKG